LKYEDDNTPYVKGSQKVTPKKTDHKHEYIRPFYMNRIRRFDGTITTDKYKFTLPIECVICGNIKKRARRGTYTEIEVSVTEGHKLRKN
jgi:hypothetical protein